MSDKTAKDRGVGHVAIDCYGITSTGRACRRFEWFAIDRQPPMWLCHDHREPA